MWGSSAVCVAGGRIQKLTDMNLADMNTTRTTAEKTAMVRAARQLLSAITKVLLLADRIVVKQLLLSKDKVGHHQQLLLSKP